MKNWKAKVWLTALALLAPCIVSGEPRVVGAAEQSSVKQQSSEQSAAAELSAETEPSAAAGSADDMPPAVGSLTLQWTLSGRREPLDCGGLGIDRFQVSLTSAGGVDGDSWDAPCDAFQISIDLPPGVYTGEAVMIDRLDRPVTLNVPVEQVDVVAGRDVAKTVDFPVAAFL